MDKQKLITKEELICKLEYNLIEEFINLRKGSNITQKELAEQSGTLRATVNRVERALTSPTIGTMLKLLEPLGYTLKIVPLEQKSNNNEKKEGRRK